MPYTKDFDIEIDSRTGLPDATSCLGYVLDPPGGLAKVERLQIPFEGEASVSKDPVCIGNVVSVIASWSDFQNGQKYNELGEAEYHLVVELKDKRVAYVVAWHDYSGWG